MYYVFTLFFMSGTEVIIVQASDENRARHYLAINYPTAKYISRTGICRKFHTAP